MSRIFFLRRLGSVPHRLITSRIATFTHGSRTDLGGLFQATKPKNKVFVNPSFVACRWLTTSDYELDAEETLESLCEKFEALLDSRDTGENSDVTLANGVLTLTLEGHGTYVINKQSPNKQKKSGNYTLPLPMT